MVNAQRWLDGKYPAEVKARVKKIGGPKQNLNRIGDDLLSVFTKGRPFSSIFSNVINDDVIEDNIILEGPLSLKGFFNLEDLDISNHKVTALDISDCSQLRELDCDNNLLTNLDVSNNRQIEFIHFSGNQLTNIDFTGLDKIEKVYCNDNKLNNLDFLKALNPTKVVNLRLANNKFPARNLSCFSSFVNLHRLSINGNPFYGSLKPLSGLHNLRELDVSDTDINSGLEYLSEDFFNINPAASGLRFTGAYFSKKLRCSGELAKQLENYKIEGSTDPLRNYDWQAWKLDHQEPIYKAKEQIKREELTKTQEWEVVAKEIKELHEKLRCDVYQKTHY
ncbi:hypothetical protein RclHR1_03010008 [Rhizophagus clarus]|uniref:T9SS type A sorting domain-containing protein n=1 Tax=Rhizophagus clarus TaxID=94130 RepID=A0A2Z6R637_9GLOM|nr:hypothetical protein RclHR1_03010008 [Rhizophagus clarus]GES85622.1 T9SS type A sorting domain-containing protein [Rhizophagus clarus]